MTRSSRVRTVAVAAGGAPWESAVLDTITDSTTLHLHRRCLDVAELLGLSRHCDVAVVSTELAGLDADVVATLVRDGVRVVGLGNPERGRHLGMTVVAEPDDLEAEVTAPAPVETATAASRLIAVWGPHGAPGRSTVAASIAGAWAHAGTDVILVDCDARGGALAQMFAVLDDVSGLVAACRDANRGDVDAVVEQAVVVEANLRLMTGVARAEMWAQVRQGPFEIVLRELARDCEAVVVDLGPGLDPQASHVLAAADQVVVVGRADPVGLARLVRTLHDLQVVRPDPQSRCTLVVNQMRSTSAWSQSDVRAAVSRLAGVDPEVFLPADYKTLDTAALRGKVPAQVAPGAPFVEVMSALADSLAVIPSR